MLMLIWVVAMILSSFSYAPHARALPLLIGVVTLLLGVLILVDQIHPIKMLRGLDASLSELAVKQGKSDVSGGESTEQIEETGVIVIASWLIGFSLLIFFAGFSIAIILFIFLFLMSYGKFSWMKSIVITAVIFGTTYAMFEIFMKVQLFKGFFFGELIPPL